MKSFTSRFALAATFLVAALLIPVEPAAAATTYEVDPAHSDVSFQVRHLMAKVRGGFNDFSGTIVRDDEDLAKASVEFRIQAASIDTRNDSRDEHLRSADFFDVARFPEISFRSTAVEKVSDEVYRVTGPFTLHGVTKVLTLAVNYAGEVKDPRGVVRAGYSLATRLDRKDFGIEWNRKLDAGGYLLSDEVVVEVSIEAKQIIEAAAQAQ